MESAVSGRAVYYYIVPFGYSKWDFSAKNLTLPLYFKIEGGVETISPSTLAVTNLKTGEHYESQDVRLRSNGSHNNARFLVYEAEFAVSPSALEVFQLTFAQNVYGCSIPPITYTKQEGSLNWSL